MLEDYRPTARREDWLVEVYTNTSRNSIANLNAQAWSAIAATEIVKRVMARNGYEPGKYRLCTRRSGQNWRVKPWKTWETATLTENRKWKHHSK